MSYDNPNTVVAVFLQTLSTTAVCLGPRLFKKKKKIFFSFNVCVYQSQDRSSLRCNNGCPVEFSWALPAHSPLLAARCQPARGSLSSSPTAEPFWSVRWWGLTTLCKLHPRSEGGLILPEARCGEGEAKEQSLLGMEMGWVRLFSKFSHCCLLKGLFST